MDSNCKSLGFEGGNDSKLELERKLGGHTVTSFSVIQVIINVAAKYVSIRKCHSQQEK